MSALYEHPIGSGKPTKKQFGEAAESDENDRNNHECFQDTDP
jgi:hypothetical protein